MSNLTNGLKVGDKVTIINAGKQYTTYTELYTLAGRVKKGYLENGDTGVVVWFGYHGTQTNVVIAIIETDDGKVVAIDAIGLEKLPVVEEVEVIITGTEQLASAPYSTLNGVKVIATLEDGALKSVRLKD